MTIALNTQLQLSPTFENGSRSFSVHTNNSHIVLNVHSEWGTCKLIKDGVLEYTNCTNNTLASLMFGLNAYKIHHSIDGVYALNIYRGSNVLSITLTAYGKEGNTNEIEPNIPLIPSFPYHRLVTNQFHAFLYVAAYDDDDKEDPFFVKIQVGCKKLVVGLEYIHRTLNRQIQFLVIREHYRCTKKQI